jgi:hypothetical protein
MHKDHPSIDRRAFGKLILAAASGIAAGAAIACQKESGGAQRPEPAPADGRPADAAAPAAVPPDAVAVTADARSRPSGRRRVHRPPSGCGGQAPKPNSSPSPSQPAARSVAAQAKAAAAA